MNISFVFNPKLPLFLLNQSTNKRRPFISFSLVMDTNELQDGFSLFDKKGDGKIAAGEIGTVLRSLGTYPTQTEVEKLQKELGGPDARITFAEFSPIFKSVASSKPAGTQDDYVEGLKVFDKDGTGNIPASELRHVLTSLGEKLSDEDVDQLLQNLNVSGDGSINAEDFVSMVMSA